MKAPSRVPHLAWAVSLAFIIFIGGGVAYWNIAGAHPARCLYGDATCSLAVSTYLLCLLTSAAFIAAFAAAHYAKEALEHERAVILSVERCRRDKHKGEYTKAEVCYIAAVYDGFKNGLPQDFSEHKYRRADFEVYSVGRSPAVLASIQANVTKRDGESFDYGVEVGYLKVRGRKHLTIWVANDLETIKMMWTGRGSHMNGEQLKVLVDENTGIVPSFQMDYGEAPAAQKPADVKLPATKDPKKSEAENDKHGPAAKE